MSTLPELNITSLIRDAREIMSLLGVTEAANVLPELRRTLEVGGILAHARKALHERDAARAEVERLSGERDKALAWRDQMQESGEAWQREAERLKAAQPRTAAEVWAEYEERTRSAVRMVNRRLAEALDREAGL